MTNPQKPSAIHSKPKVSDIQNPFKFLDYSFNDETFTATFRYQGIANLVFTETVTFAKPNHPTRYDKNTLDRALFLSFLLVGTSYYKAQPTKTIDLNFPLDSVQADFFTTVYTHGLSQFIFENNLKPSDLATFTPAISHSNQLELSTQPIKVNQPSTPKSIQTPHILSLQSGGKDSLLTATLLHEKNLPFSSWYLSNSDTYPQILDQLPTKNLYIAYRRIDRDNLKKAAALGAKNGHVPITYIVQSFALIQAILLNQNTILTSIGQEGNEPHAKIDNLPINHQWSKTWPAELLFADYVKNYVSPDLHIGSPLRQFTELKIAKLFVEKCWKNYGHSFSSCNNANYRQNNDNSTLKWCGNCPKCANSYLLFAPFLPKSELDSIFGQKDLIKNSNLTKDFAGLLGVNQEMKPFECIGEINELRKAYHLAPAEYSKLPFTVPDSDFDLDRPATTQDFIKNLNLY